MSATAGVAGSAAMLDSAAWLDAVALAQSAAGRQASPSAVLVLQLVDHRRFRVAFGLEAGARIDTETAALVARVLRPVDRICRIAGDAFAVLLPGLRSGNHALLAANRLIRALRDELRIDGMAVNAVAVVGIADVEAGCEPDELLRRADHAAAAAARGGRSVQQSDGRSPVAELPSEALDTALRGNRLEAWLQPLWDLRHERISGAESLARWHCADRGTVSPSLFVAVAEQSGLIDDLTRWSLNASLRHCHAARLIDPSMRVSVNLSPRKLDDALVVEQVLESLRLWDVPASSLMLEITEGALMQNARRSGRIIERFREAGVGIALDDFGSGYSSFAYLRDFGATELKIDQSFITPLVHDRRAQQLVRSMVDLAHHLDIEVVAEGVEDERTLDLVRAFGCDIAQGNHVAAAQPASEFLALLGGVRPAA